MIKSEIEKMNTENERLRTIFKQVSDKYRDLQTHVYQVLHHQHNSNVEQQQHHNLKVLQFYFKYIYIYDDDDEFVYI